VLKLGTAAAWVTLLASALMSALEDDPLEDDPAPAGAEVVEEVPDEELLDEQAASMSAAAVIANADALRLAREMRGARAAPPTRLKPYR
jgi:hypothetical protein